MYNIDSTFICNDEIERQNLFKRKIYEINMGKTKKYSIMTFGCQMNENDSEKLAGMLVEMGYVKSDNSADSDIIIYNTCCVRENAELKVYGHLGSLKKLKKNNPDMVIAVCGCMMQQKEVVSHIMKVYRHVDLIFGTHNLHKLPELLFKTTAKNRQRTVEILESEGYVTEGIPVEREDGIKAWVTAMYGCNNFCSYCIVPYVRGRERSRNHKDIINEVRMLGCNGYKEITLLGQNINSYGKDKSDILSFPELLYRINEIDGIERIRFMTSHPKDLSNELVKAMKECEKVCEHLHLPLQSGSDAILDKMNRKYNKNDYIELALYVKESIPGIAVTTDIIVGYPGETEEDFENTLDVVRKVRFDSAYTFLYSKRPGTPAADKPGQIDEETKKIRFDKLIDVQNKISKEINDSLSGQILEVLVEGLSKNNAGILTGRSRTNKIVNFAGDRSFTGKLVYVRIEKAKTWSLEGKLHKPFN